MNTFPLHRADLGLISRADGALHGKNSWIRAHHIQALGNICRAGGRGFPVSKANRSKLADAMYDLSRAGVVTKAVEPGDPPALAYYATDYARHILLLAETKPADGKSALLTLVAQIDAARAKVEKEVAPGALRSPCWQMTRDVWIDRTLECVRAIRSLTPEEEQGYRRVTAEEHEQEVRWAVEDGLAVPPEVLSDYPDISRLYEEAPTHA